MRVLSPPPRWSSCLVAAVAFLLPSCAWDGHIRFLGYSSAPNYDPSIKTVRVPIFENYTLKRGVEDDLTRAVIREIESKTPFKVASEGGAADTELIGRIVSYNKRLILYNQLGEVRNAEITMTVELVWRDLRPGCGGEILSLPPRAPPSDLPVPPELLPPVPAKPPPVVVQGRGTFIPELGESITSAEQSAVRRMAEQIVSMMEKPW
ncbi:MAG: LPS assembly lipoprotein LptE [Gemmataceae bacterium]|nr:LPS assembly lipoprotein LptE [Gemmataceae bacterium]